MANQWLNFKKLLYRLLVIKQNFGNVKYMTQLGSLKLMQSKMSSLNSYHDNIQITMKIEQNNQDRFLDVLFISIVEAISTTVCCKVTNTVSRKK